jgi:peptidoglycan/xylan/chitin deacetylase (PgdA/CDA1 family)
MLGAGGQLGVDFAAMCWRCAVPIRLSRRSFHTGLLAATIDPTCLLAPPEEIVEPEMRLLAPAGAARTVALTLDACSGAADMRIIETLLDLAVPATIFVTGLWLHGNPHALGLLLARPDLFTLENHGERHLPPVLGSRTVYGLQVAGTLEAVQREVERGADALVAAGGVRPRWYRGAAALYSPSAIGAIEALGFTIAGYSLSADEGASLPAAAVARRMGAAKNGEVLLAHVNRPGRPSGAGVAEGVAALRRAGAVFVGLDTLPIVAEPCVVHRGHLAA